MRLKRFVKILLACTVLSCSMVSVSVAARDPKVSPTVPEKPDHSPQTGDHRPNPVVPFAGAAVLAGVAVVSGKKLKKENE